MSPKKAYFIGIGGIGMSALAQLMQDTGVSVSGSDREASPTTELLAKKGISVVIGQQPENVPEDADLVVYTEAAWEDNPERVRAKELGLLQKSYFEQLGEVSSHKRTVAIAGTHGKTTTTGMTGKLLINLGGSPTIVVGSILKDYYSNYYRGASDLFVVEACEYKGDFLTLHPSILIVTNIEWDHTDYYPDLASVQASFLALMQKVPDNGAIITDAHHPHIAPLVEEIRQRRNVKIIDYAKTFRNEAPFQLLLPGDFNQANARAAAAAAQFLFPDASMSAIRSSLSDFHGTWRRFEYKGKTKNGAEVYDDYAHHPTAVKVTLAELRKKTSRKLYVAFHPHLYSRTRDLLPEFATAFTDADSVCVAPIYPAREVDDGTISSAMLAAEITAHGTPAEAKTVDEIQEALETYPEAGDVIVTMGAGDIYKVADALVA